MSLNERLFEQQLHLKEDVFPFVIIIKIFHMHLLEGRIMMAVSPLPADNVHLQLIRMHRHHLSSMFDPVHCDSISLLTQ